jgi:hypothetical protein
MRNFLPPSWIHLPFKNEHKWYKVFWIVSHDQSCQMPSSRPRTDISLLPNWKLDNIPHVYGLISAISGKWLSRKFCQHSYKAVVAHLMCFLPDFSANFKQFEYFLSLYCSDVNQIRDEFMLTSHHCLTDTSLYPEAFVASSESIIFLTSVAVVWS